MAVVKVSPAEQKLSASDITSSSSDWVYDAHDTPSPAPDRRSANPSPRPRTIARSQPSTQPTPTPIATHAPVAAPKKDVHKPAILEKLLEVPLSLLRLLTSLIALFTTLLALLASPLGFILLLAATPFLVPTLLRLILRSASETARELFGVESFAKLISVPLLPVIPTWVAGVRGNMTAVRERVLPVMCRIPGVSILASDICVNYTAASSSPSNKSPLGADFPALIDLQLKSFSSLLTPFRSPPSPSSAELTDTSSDALASHLQQTQSAASDLRTLIKLSSLASKEALDQTLEEFAIGAGCAAREIRRLGARVGGAVDGARAVNGWAMGALLALPPPQEDSLAGKLKNALSLRNPADVSRTQVARIFAASMSALESSLHECITQSHTTLSTLDHLESTLQTLHTLLHTSKSHINSARADILSDLWTYLGSRTARVQLLRHREHLELLQTVEVQRRVAKGHILEVLGELEEFEAGLQVLRERVARPVVIGEGGPEGGEVVPVEVHVASIQMGIERLAESRVVGGRRGRVVEGEREGVRVVRITGDEEVE
ncbi:hypothetical protein SAICODRAFT_21943 [Saitoella complicata NRRL Y-17804]|uniref:Uncharacterized protein n=1 Tax=Saitoella complicata (strain BCRC 22490 / CBS 7301 / JCM 7358 / NBRC 10748 / NRRL Y-17804) TaxID=698492 RepID=A0A0E9NRU8_SAICN|nr:uncharacterized protein SAICODRAFT_21943 [Saitoella complicata NRRL Y-17804]ODQ49961.1 hypothetical protein SAICODRAFT_21943 [Saitoella complicata NRRL Y-17804]GAO52602.1 hypothetical protein G7K_6675-t1 [Saitoella complicata NRRL Y-17804]